MNFHQDDHHSETLKQETNIIMVHLSDVFSFHNTIHNQEDIAGYFMDTEIQVNL